MTKTIAAISFVLLAPTLARAGGVAVFEGPPGGVGSVVVYDEQSGAPIASDPALAGVRLLSIDFTGRTELEALLPTRPRHRADVSGASRLALPNGQGSLYRFERASSAGGAVFGCLHVGRDGTARAVLERAGDGATGTSDPFVGRVSVSPNGDAFLCATRAGAGGDLLEVGLAPGAPVVDRTAGIPPQRFSANGLALTASAGIGASARGVWRYDRAVGGDASAVSFAPDGPTYFSGELVTSRNGLWAATTAGSAADALHVYAFDAGMVARRATTAPGVISGIGSEPESQDGPHLAVSDDGALCAWRTEDGVSREAFSARTQPAAGEQPEHLTRDELFLETLDEVGGFIFRPARRLLIAVGEQEIVGQDQLGRTDFFEVTHHDGAAPTFENLSLSSGDATAPFFGIPQVEPRGKTLLPDESGFLFHNEQGNNNPVHLVRFGQTGASVLLPAVHDLDLVDLAGRHMLFSIESGLGNEPQELYRWSWAAGGAPALVASGPSETQYVRTAPRRDGWVAFVTRAPFGAGEWLDRVHLPSGAADELEPAASFFGPAVGVTALGSYAYSRGAVGAPATFATWPLDGSAPVVLAAPATPGQILPGL